MKGTDREGTEERLHELAQRYEGVRALREAE